MVKAAKPVPFPYHLPYKTLDLRQRPDLYRIGKGEEGVLLVEPYKGELKDLWRFKNPEVAQESAKALYQKFLDYVETSDFVGADLTRKWIQMGFTRARRYANHSGGKKYEIIDGHKQEIPRLDVEDQEPDKVEAAKIFKRVLDTQVLTNAEYQALKDKHFETHECQPLDLSGIEVIEGVSPRRGGQDLGELNKIRARKDKQHAIESTTKRTKSKK